jgi:hypothetical protein
LDLELPRLLLINPEEGQAEHLMNQLGRLKMELLLLTALLLDLSPLDRQIPNRKQLRFQMPPESISWRQQGL